MTLFLINAVCGPSLWKWIVFAGFRVEQVLVFGLSVTAVHGTIDNLLHILAHSRKHPTKVRWNIAINQSAQFVLMIVIGTLWFYMDPSVLEERPREALLILGFCFSFLVTRVIIVSVSKGDYPPFHLILLPLPMLLANTLVPFCPRVLLLKLSFGWCLVLYLHFMVTSISQMGDALKIKLFSVPNK